jgi:hypothetical protein
VLTIHQADNTTCRFDYYMRLALGSHNYPGSSLQAYVFSASDFKGGKKTVPLPVNQIAAQATSKDMTATEDTNTPWSVTKSATPATVHFGDICNTNTFTNTQNVGIKVTWTKLAAVPSGQVLLLTHVYATNPAARPITTTVSDQMYQGTNQSTPLGSPYVATHTVPANTANYLMETDTQTVSAVSGVTHYNDIATATYTDPATSVPVPGNTTASAGADITTGNTTNADATVTDAESITGSNLHFAVASPSSGSFTNGYTAGNYIDGTTTPNEVDWSSGSNAISGSGSITFNKTIKLDPAAVTSGTLSDTATLNGSDGFGPITAGLGVNIDSSQTSTLTINKNVSQKVSSDQTFHFDLLQNGTTVQANIPVTVTAGQTSGSAQVTGLAPGSYTVHEDTPPAGWSTGPDQTVDLSGCSNSVTFTDTLAPAVAFANKVTDPTGYQQGWTFTLTRPDSSTLPGTTNSSGQIIWSGGSSATAPLALEGTYTISETQQSGWTEVGAAQAVGSTGTVSGGTGAGASCTFTVAYPLDADLTYGCTITNKSRAHVVVNKSFEGNPLTGSEAFTFQLRDGSSASAAGVIRESEVANVGDGGTATFAYDLIPGHTYAICEVLQTNINTDLTGYNPNGDTGVVCQDFTPTPGQLVTFNVNNTPVAATAQVKKVSDPAGNEAGWVMTLTGPGTPSGGEVVTTTGTGFIPFATQLQDGGSYTITETSQPGWNQISASTDCSFTVHYPADAGRTFSCTITNQSRGQITVIKQTDPAGSSQSFSFTTSGTGYSGFSLTGQSGSNSNVQTVASPGTYTVNEGTVSGWSLDKLSCSSDTGALGGSTFDDGTAESPNATIHLAPGDDVTCTFHNTQVANLIIKKVTIPSGSSQNFTFDPSGFNSGTSFQLNGAANNQQSFNGLTPGGGYSVSEENQAGWDLTSSSCNNGNSPSAITLAAGSTVTCTFTNTQRGHIIVKKVTDPTGMTKQFTFTPSYNSGTTFLLSDGQQNDSGAIVPGSYSVAETAAGGNWTLKSATCDGTGNTPASINLQAGQTVTCTFTNQLRGNVRVVKTLNGQPLTSGQQFTFELRQGDQSQHSTVALQSLTTGSGANPGTLNFTYPLTPGVQYAICELLVAGYGPNVPSEYGPYNPGDAPNYICWNFTLTEAQANSTPSYTFNVDNSHATAKGLTIGFWKNHADPTCKKSNGKQTDVLGQYLDKITLGTITFRDPFVAGPTNADECAAVQTLSKNTFTGKGMSSDPLFNMAAQLLAADLNVNTGDTPSSTAQNAINQAQALLVKYGWNGNSYSPKLTAADAALANSLNTILDKFNNNQI